MIIVTGAAGFIGSCLVSKLNQEGFKDIVIVDDFSNLEKMKNLEGKIYSKKIHRDDFVQWLRDNHRFTQFVFPLDEMVHVAKEMERQGQRLNHQ